MRLMLACGVNTNAADYDRRTCLHLAASEGSAHIVEALLSGGADVNCVDRWGGTPLRDALRHGHSNVMTMLIGAGGKLLMEMSELAHQMCSLASEGKADRLVDLLECGADVNTANFDGRTSLHVASTEGHKAVVEALTRWKAIPDASDRWGNTAQSEAERMGHNWDASIWMV